MCEPRQSASCFHRSFSHEHFHTQDLTAASTHDRRYAHPQARAQDPERLYPCCTRFHRLVRSLAHRAGPEDLRLFQLHLVDKGVSPISINSMQTGLRFFFDITLNRPEVTAHMRHVRVAQRLPVVLSREEATRLIEATRNIKYRAALSVAYGAGLRASEVISLKVSDVDSKRHVLRIEQGKGRKDRTRYYRRFCSSVCAAGGATRGPRAKYYPTAGSFQVRIRCSP